MCKSSMYARQVRDAQVGERLIMLESEGGLPAFRRPGDAEDFLTCIRHGTCLTFAGIPPETQREQGVAATEEVVFVEDEGDYFDLVRLGDGEFVDLSAFTDDPEVGEMHVIVGEPLCADGLRALAAELASLEEPITPASPDREPVAVPS